MRYFVKLWVEDIDFKSCYLIYDIENGYIKEEEMELLIIKENIGDGELVINIYLGNCKCECGNEFNF